MRIICLFLLMVSTRSIAQFDGGMVPEEVRKFVAEHEENAAESRSHGSVSSGSLQNGKLIPYKGNNFMYFDSESYLERRAFVHSTIRDIVLSTYDSLYRVHPDRYFMIMECSHEEGGDMFPHRTHQNGLSIDFMMPLIKDGKPYYGLDTIGASHYFLTFDEQGRYSKDKSVQIDFDMVSKHIVWLNHQANKRNYEITKVIIQIELKDELYASEYGQQIKDNNIYVVQNLSRLINSLHDDHYHIDFGPR